MTENQVEDRLRAWYAADVGEGVAPESLVAAIERVPGRTAVSSARRPPGVDHFARFAAGAAAMVLVALVSITLLPSIEGVGSPSPSLAVPTTPSPPSDTANALPSSGVIEQGLYYIPWGNLRPYLTMPAGWSSTDGGRTISRYAPEDFRPALKLTVHGVGLFVAIDACTLPVTLVQALTVENLTTSLVNQVGVQRSGPADVSIGSYRATKFVLTLPGGCPGPEDGHGPVFVDWDGPNFGLSYGATGTIYVIDVGTENPLVITTSNLDALPEDVVEMEAIISSIDIR